MLLRPIGYVRVIWVKLTNSNTAHPICTSDQAEKALTFHFMTLCAYLLLCIQDCHHCYENHILYVSEINVICMKPE